MSGGEEKNLHWAFSTWLCCPGPGGLHKRGWLWADLPHSSQYCQNYIVNLICMFVIKLLVIKLLPLVHHGAQRRSVVHNVVLYPRGGAPRRSLRVIQEAIKNLNVASYSQDTYTFLYMQWTHGWTSHGGGEGTLTLLAAGISCAAGVPTLRICFFNKNIVVCQARPAVVFCNRFWTELKNPLWI